MNQETICETVGKSYPCSFSGIPIGFSVTEKSCSLVDLINEHYLEFSCDNQVGSSVSSCGKKINIARSLLLISSNEEILYHAYSRLEGWLLSLMDINIESISQKL